MDLRQQVTIFPPTTGQSSVGIRMEGSEQMSLFEAVRRWTDDEGVPFDIAVAGNRLTKEQIEAIAHSQPFQDLLLAFDERR